MQPPLAHQPTNATLTGLQAALPAGVALASALSLMLWAYACWWLLVAVFSVIDTYKHSIPFNLGWWGSVFPLTTFTGVTLELGDAMHSRAFVIVGAFFTCATLCVWVFVAAMTIRGGWKGQLFHSPCLMQVPANEHHPAPFPIVRAASILEGKLSMPSFINSGLPQEVRATSRNRGSMSSFPGAAICFGCDGEGGGGGDGAWGVVRDAEG